MRRTEQEFKEEVLKRTKAYRQKQAKTRKSLLAAGLCICLCVVVLKGLSPLGATSDSALMMEDVKLESAISMEAAPAERAEPMEAVPEEMADAFAGNGADGVMNDKSPAVISTVWIIAEGEELLLEDADAEIIRDYLTYGQWIPAAANCLCDVTFAVDDTVYRYHSDCGTVQDEFGMSLTLSEEDKIIFNEILQKYLG